MGNILTQKRHKQNGTQIEDMTYRYQRDANGFLLSNRLYHVNDAIASTIDQTDIDDQGAGFNPLNVNINGAYNYVYDEEGRLVKDVTEGIHQIVWRVDGKVREINRTSTSTRSRLKFDYDAMGRRIAKHVYNNQTGLLEKSTYYLLDAQGNTMSTYDYAPGPNQTMSYQLKERHIFGSARLGMYAESVLLVENPSTENTNILVNQGFKQYELTNHLGNVLTVIHDIKIPLNNGSVPGVSSYRVGIRTCSDYSPFGVELDGRTVSGGYRYGFQNQEKDDQVMGEGNSYDYGARMYNPQMGKWLSRDALSAKKPYMSSYQSMKNNPIIYIDQGGHDEWYFYEDGSWKFIETSGAAKFYTIDADGVKNDIYSLENWVLAMIPGVDNPDEDLSDELMARPMALALFGVLYPKYAYEPQILAWNKQWMIPIDIGTALMSLPGLVKGVYKAGKVTYSFLKAGKTVDAVMDANGLITSGNKVYSAEGFTNFMKGIKNSFKSLGYNVKSMQKGTLSRDIVNNKKTNMLLDNAYDFTAKENQIGGYKNTTTGEYVINEGNHRFQAAREIFEETGNSSYIDGLIKNGRWTNIKSNQVGTVSFPKVK